MGKDMLSRDPFDVFAPFVQFNRQWTNALRARNADDAETRRIAPAMDVAETADELVLTAELPGLPKDAVKITIEDGVLTISGEKKFENVDEGRNYHVVERRYGTFQRQVTLSTQVDASKASASYEHGVLTITVPKAEAAKPRELEIS